MTGNSGARQAELNEEIRHVLTEIRMVLPGAQALLGFQLITFVLSDFEKLPYSSKAIHSVSLILMCVSVIGLMTPAAYHRIVEHGENTEHFHRFTGAMLLASLVPLALAICGDFYVVMKTASASQWLPITLTGILLLFFGGLWFGLPLWKRRR
jgi:hypothetical protein